MLRSDTWRLRTVVSATATCGAFRNWPSFSALAIVSAASRVDWPVIFTAPRSCLVRAPASLMRASVVRSGCWNTVTCTVSPGPRLSAAARASPGAASAMFGETALCESSSPRHLSKTSQELPFELRYVFDAGRFTQPLHLGLGQRQALAPGEKC